LALFGSVQPFSARWSWCWLPLAVRPLLAAGELFELFVMMASVLAMNFQWHKSTTLSQPFSHLTLFLCRPNSQQLGY
jgi:hypothetical protein